MKKSKISDLVKFELILRTEEQCSVKQKTAIRTSLKSLWQMFLVQHRPQTYFGCRPIFLETYLQLF